MLVLTKLGSLFRTLFRKSRLERELDDELQSVLELLTERHVEAGLDREAARRAARLELGGVEQVKEEVRTSWIGSGLLTFLRDLRYAWRALCGSPSFVVVAIITLALGIGANTAIFSIANAVLREPLPFKDPDRLVFVWGDMTAAGYPRGPLSGPELKDLRERSSLFSDFQAIWATTATITGDGDPEQLRIGLVTTGFFPLLGVDAALGRTLSIEDETTAAPTAILLSASLWRRRYGGDPGIAGRTVLVNDRPVMVVGVMPDAFKLFMPPDASVPDDLQAWALFNKTLPQGPRGQMFLRVVGRLAPGVTFQDASNEIAAIAAGISRDFPEYGAGGRAFRLVSLHDDGVREVRPALLALSAGVTILLLIACVNVASLLVARAAARQRENALHVALGAGRARLFSRCLAEGILLAGAGAMAGVLTARFCMKLLVGMRPESLARLEVASLDRSVLLLTGLAALVLGFLLSLAPLGETLRTRFVSVLQGGRGGGSSMHYRLRAGLVVIQLALSIVLLVGAGLLVRTVVELGRVDPGFRWEGRLTFRLGLPASRYPTLAAAAAFSRRFQEELGALPGVTSVGAMSHLPFDILPNWSTTYLSAPGQDESLARRADSRAVTASLFETMGARLVEGRFFTEDDNHTSQPVVIVDESLARLAWPGRSAIGQRLAVDPAVTGHPITWVSVVGVVGHLRIHTLTEDVREQVFFPVRQALRNPMCYVVRTEADPATLTSGVRGILGRLDPQLPIYEVRLLGDYVARARATHRFTMWLIAAFALVAVTLSCVGVYGVMAYSVAARRHEMAVRLALGARPSAVVALMVRQGLGLAAVGVAVGVPAAFGAAHLIEDQLFGVRPGDLAIYGSAGPLLVLATVAASWLPARRAVAIEPLEALRAD